MVIIVDTREQTPFGFGDDVPVVRAALSVGDYAADGPLGRPPIAIERKSIPDLYGTLTSGKDRFARELERAAAQGITLHIVIEGDYGDLFRPPPAVTRTPPAFIVGCLMKLAISGTPFHTPGRERAADLAFRLLRTAYMSQP